MQSSSMNQYEGMGWRLGRAADLQRVPCWYRWAGGKWPGWRAAAPQLERGPGAGTRLAAVDLKRAWERSAGPGASSRRRRNPSAVRNPTAALRRYPTASRKQTAHLAVLVSTSRPAARQSSVR